MIRNKLLIDVSVIARIDAGTGIQRAVRELSQQLIQNPPSGYDVKLVRASRVLGYRYVVHSPRTNTYSNPIFGAAVRIAVGDVFLGLDFSAHILPRHHRQLDRWNKAGAKLFFVVYDLLPAQCPEWFTKKGAAAHSRWLFTIITHATGLICISRAVANDLTEWLSMHDDGVNRKLNISWFHLGSDVATSVPRQGKLLDLDNILKRLRQRSTVIMVGTIEPRKGYTQALSAFEILWQEEKQVNLVIVGKAAWGVETLTKRLTEHPERGNHLFWFESASDEVLCSLYQASSGLLMASEGEGFGLPLVEAAHYGKPILARDLPVFQEIAGEHATYFSGNTPHEMSSALNNWIKSIANGSVIKSIGIECISWEKSASMLFERIRHQLEKTSS